MNPILKNVLAVIAGIVIGSIVNLALVNLGPMVIPPPEGTDISTMEGLKSAMPLFQPKHFIFVFLGHALGTLVGAFTAYKLAANNKMKFAWGIAGWFLLGGIASVFMLPAPTWYSAIDLICAYIPMGWLAGKLAGHQPVTGNP